MTWLKLRGPVRFPQSRFEMEDGWMLPSYWSITPNTRLWLARLWWRIHQLVTGKTWLLLVLLSVATRQSAWTHVSCSPISHLSRYSSLIDWVMVSRSKAQQHVITPHKRRGPIAAEFSTPGPASVKLPGLFGSKFPKIVSKNSFSFIVRHILIKS